MDYRKLERYYLDDLKVYCPRNDLVLPTPLPRTVEVERLAMAFAGFPGQKFLNLSPY
jgi:hypothetical protein